MRARSSRPCIAITLFALALGAPDPASAANLTVNGAQRYQTIGGMGVNLNTNSWNGGEFTTALDMLVGPPGTTNGSSVVRLAHDPMDWVQNQADITPLHNLDAATLTRIYETPRMQEIWSTLAYLNGKGLTGKQIILSFMGWTPTWIGGSGQYGVDSHITPGKEPAFATMIASLVYYGRVVKGLSFTGLSPLNEMDWSCLEGPCMSSSQFATVMHALAVELDHMGLTDIRFTGPDAASPTQSDSYISAMMADPLVAARVELFGLHVYGYSIGPRTSYSGKTYWLTETASNCNGCDNGGAPPQGEWAYASETGSVILGHLALGMCGVLLWEGHDSFWYHHNVITTMGLLAYDGTTGVYTKRKRYYVNSQINGFVPRGSIRVGMSETVSGTVLAFLDTTAGTVSIVGNNTSGSPVVISGQLTNTPATSALKVYVTDSGSKNLFRENDVPVVNGAFVDTIPANSFFSMSSAVDNTPPAIAAITATANANGTETIAWLTNEASNSRVDYGTAAGSLTLVASTPAMVTQHSLTLTGLTPNATYYYRLTSTDPSGYSATSPNPPAAPLTFTSPQPVTNTPPVAAAAGLPQSGPAPLLVNFSAANSTDTNGDSLTFSWTFGDGGTAAGRLVSHVYAAVGTYAAVVTANDGRGGTDTASVSISVAPPPAFPSTAILDNFNRANGAIGGTWIDQTTSFTINGNALAPNSGTSHIEWAGVTFGPDQEVFVKLNAISVAASPEHNLMLKTQGTSWNAGHIEICYSAPNSRVNVNTFTSPSTWTNRGTINSVTFAAGDRFGARARADGTVLVYKNGAQIGSVSVAAWAFSAQGGRIGLSCVNAAAARFEDFGGGNYTPNMPPDAVAEATPQSGMAPLAVNLSGDKSSDGNGDALSHVWTFGDGQTGTGNVVAHHYATPGTYAAILTTSDGRGGVDTASVAITVSPSSVSTPRDGTLPGTISLSGAYPNPTHRMVTFSLELPSGSDVEMRVLDILGREVWKSTTQHYGAGRWTLSWNGRTSRGQADAGVFLACVRVGAELLTRRIAVIR